MFSDTHCHIHEADYPDQLGAIERAHAAGVGRMVCVGTDEKTSLEATRFASKHANIVASVGLHPHDASGGADAIEQLETLIKDDKKEHVNKIVAVGECGLDYFYNHSPRVEQLKMLEAQLQLAHDFDLTVIFHVREAFNDFWPVFDNFSGLRGVLHSYTDTDVNLEAGLSRGLYIGVNGISTFTKVEAQRDMFASIPLEQLVLETDSPFLTPKPYRGKVNEPAFITHIAQHLANLQAINLEELSRATERNATQLFFNTNK